MARRREVSAAAAVRRLEVVRLHRDEGLPLARIAERWGVTRQAAHKVWTRAKAEMAAAAPPAVSL